MTQAKAMIGNSLGKGIIEEGRVGEAKPQEEMPSGHWDAWRPASHDLFIPSLPPAVDAEVLRSRNE